MGKTANGPVTSITATKDSVHLTLDAKVQPKKSFKIDKAAIGDEYETYVALTIAAITSGLKVYVESANEIEGATYAIVSQVKLVR